MNQRSFLINEDIFSDTLAIELVNYNKSTFFANLSSESL
jgi:hypothetical protein